LTFRLCIATLFIRMFMARLPHLAFYYYIASWA
jgi:hypothetical protein